MSDGGAVRTHAPLRALRLVAWRCYLGAGALAVAAGPLLPPVPRQVLYAATAASVAVAIMVGLRRYRPRHPRPWRLFAAGLGGAIVSVVGNAVTEATTGHRPAFPSVWDACYVVAYPLVMAAMAGWVRRDPDRPGSESLVDSAIIVSGLAVLSWTFVLDPLLDRQAEFGAAIGRHTMYVLLDLLLMTVTLRTVFRIRLWTVSSVLTMTAMGALLVGDNVYYIGLAADPGGLSEALSALVWLGGYVLLGASALHPSMGWSTGAVERTRAVASPARLTLFGVLSALPTAVVAGAVSVRGWSDAANHIVVPLLIGGANGMLLVIRLSMLTRVAHRRAADLEQQRRALADALRAQEQLRGELTRRATRDDLTGLGNRSVLRDHLDRLLADPAAAGHGLLLLDLDGFKDVNDAYGHPAGDALLVAVADRLRRVAAQTDVLVRLGGDEFAMLLVDADATTVAAAAGRIVDALRPPLSIGDRQVHVTASVGTLVASAPMTAADALRRVDLALYAAKAAGKNRVAGYTPQLAADQDRRTALLTDLRRAMAAEEFEVHYQPVVELATGRVAAVEALLRWSPGSRPVAPADFVPIAEESGLIVPLGAWVLHRALRDVARWHRRYGMSVTVNVSGRQLREPDLVDSVLAALDAHRLPGEALVVEITETVLVEAPGAAGGGVRPALQRLRDRGVRVAVDDFGTGYSSLAYLRRLPVDILKVDRAFVQGDEGEHGSTALIRTVLDLAEALGLSAIGEAVETEAQAERLRQLRCPLVQGFHYARPVAASQLDALLAATGGVLACDPRPAGDPGQRPGWAAAGTGTFAQSASEAR